MYNVEKYIDKCLASCVGQDISYGDYEIICVNDGSLDNSGKIAEAYASKYSNIKVFFQPNRGLSEARNMGLKHAQGEYVMFLDSDDWIVENCLTALCKYLIENDVDMLNIPYVNVYENGRAPEFHPKYIINNIEKGLNILIRGGYPTMAQLSIYKRSLLKDNELLFYPGIYHEDAEFMPRVLYYAKRVASYDSYVYNYLQRNEGSITSHYKLKNGEDAIKVCDSLYQFSKDFEPNIVKAYANRISQIILTHMCRLHFLNKDEQNIIMNIYKEHLYIFEYMQKSSCLKYKIAGWLLMHNVYLSLKMFSLIIR